MNWKICASAGTDPREVVIIPFKHLDSDGFKDGSDKNFMGESINYLKNGSVPDPGSAYSASNRLLDPPVLSATGTAPTTGMKIDSKSRHGTDGNTLRFRFHGSADNPIVDPSAAIDWDFEIQIVASNHHATSPQWQLRGNLQDGFPGYEVYVRDSDGNGGDNLGTTIYQFDPIAVGHTPFDLFDNWNDETVPPANGPVP